MMDKSNPLISFLIGFVVSIQLLNQYPTLSHYSLHCLIASFLIALFLLKTFEHLNTTIWFILFILSVSLAGITYISLKVSTETHLFTTELPTSREFHGIVKIKESLKKNPNYPNTLFIAQFIEESSNNRLKDNERIFISVRTDAFSDELFSIGNTISLRGLHSYITRNNTNRFGNTLRKKNVYSKITHVKSAQLVHLSEETFIHQLRSQFIHTLELGAPKNKDFEGIYKAMLIGQKQDLSEKQK